MLKYFILFTVFAASIIISQEKIPLEKVFEDDEYQFVSVAVSKEGRIFIGYPRWNDKHNYSVIELLKDGTVKPYPDAGWNSWQLGEDGRNKWVCTQPVYIDDENYLWVVDPASPKMKGVYNNSHKAVKFNLAGNTIERIYYFEGIADSDSYLNDIRVDNSEGFAYITNSSTGGIVVLNLATGEGREVLKQHRSTLADSSYVFEVDGKRLLDSAGSVRMNSDGIAISPDESVLYFKPLTDDHLYKVETSYLRTAAPEVIAANTNYLGRVSTTDGMIMDKSGNLYLGDIETNTIYQYNPATGQKTPLILNNPLLSWPDTYSISTDGYMYVTCSHIHQMPKYNNGVDLRTTPYTLYRFKLP